MIAKRISCSTVKGVLEYNSRKEEKNSSQIIATRHLPQDTSKNIADTLKLYIKGNRAKKNKYEHIILSFPTSFDLNELNRVEIIDSYLDKIGFSNQPYVAYLHTDTPNAHIHLVTTPIDIVTKKRIYYRDKDTKGRGVDLTKRISERAVQAIRKEYNIELDREAISNKNMTTKNRVLYAIDVTTKKYKVRSPAVLAYLLKKKHDIELIHKSQDRSLSGVMYRFEDSPPLKGSIFHHTANHRALEKIFSKHQSRYNAESAKNYKPLLEEILKEGYTAKSINKVLGHFGLELVTLDSKHDRRVLIDHNTGEIHNYSAVTRQLIPVKGKILKRREASDVACMITLENKQLLSPFVKTYDDASKAGIMASYNSFYSKAYNPDTSKGDYVFRKTAYYTAMSSFIRSGVYDDMEFLDRRPKKNRAPKRPPRGRY